MSRSRRSPAFWLLIIALLLLLALGVDLLVLGLTRPPFVQTGSWAI